MLGRLRGVWIFTKLDLRNAYHLIRIKEGDEHNTGFRSQQCQFEHQVTPFGLTNTPATYEPYIDNCLQPFTDNFAVCYIEDKLIYSPDGEDHE
jgi:hypothetical protein